ncbi:hypothetical protein [Chitinimonas sp. BJB300]|uniref:hypothetical protein n=1 Tax=Chitinimonas sp. BJB300 TaxID=1559339 RepID=UPI001111FDBF|nr:hypothetical protein [Chitinimonas sp. BJB300]TSJ88212.1 hypothetical protein FG002_011935 [Chitinimonas sp. BJB300]
MSEVINNLKQVVDCSSQISQWSLVIFGGSVATIIGTSHHKPAQLSLKLTYFLFVPAWAFLAISLWQGDKLVRSYLSSLFVKEDMIPKISQSINELYLDQMSFLKYSLLCLGFWLLIYLAAWIFIEEKVRDE